MESCSRYVCEQRWQRQPVLYIAVKHLIENANHSLETGEVHKDIENMAYIMELTDAYIKSISI